MARAGHELLRLLEHRLRLIHLVLVIGELFVRYRFRRNWGRAVATALPFNFKIYSRAGQAQLAGAEGLFCVGTQSASLTFVPDDDTGVEFQTFVLGLDLYVPPATP